MTHDGMEVADGDEAGFTWEKTVHAEQRSEERKRLKKALLAYRKQDTLTIVRLLKVLYEHTRDR